MVDHQLSSIKINKTIFISIIAIIALAFAVFLSPVSSAQISEGLEAATKGTDLDTTADVGSIIANIVNIFLYIIGVVAVIMIIFGGFQYLTSAGDSTKAQKARNVLLYAVIGLVIAIFAYAIINFVMEEVTGSTGTSSSSDSSINTTGRLSEIE